MWTKRILLAVCAFAFLIPLAGCRHSRCCGSGSSSYAPPTAPCCDHPRPPPYLPPGQ